MPSTITKVCTRCKQERPHNLRKESHRPERPFAYCVECRSAYNRKWKRDRKGPDALVERAGFDIGRWVSRIKGLVPSRWSTERAGIRPEWADEWREKVRNTRENAARERASWFGKCTPGTSGSTASRDELFWLLIRQEFRCPYMGSALLPDESTHLDHIIPVSRGGGGGIDNLQWVSAQANTSKAGMTHEEFIALCATVASRFAGAILRPSTEPPPSWAPDEAERLARTRPPAGAPRRPGVPTDHARREALKEALRSGLTVKAACAAAGYRSRRAFYAAVRQDDELRALMPTRRSA